MTRDEILLYADYQVDPAITDEELEELVYAVWTQLASILCIDPRESVPDPLDSNLKILLANALAFFLNNRGISGSAQSESIRNYSYSIKSTAPATLQDYLKLKFSNLLSAESKCEDFGFRVSRRGGHRRHGGCCGRL